MCTEKEIVKGIEVAETERKAKKHAEYTQVVYVGWEKKTEALKYILLLPAPALKERPKWR